MISRTRSVASLGLTPTESDVASATPRFRIADSVDERTDDCASWPVSASAAFVNTERGGSSVVSVIKHSIALHINTSESSMAHTHKLRQAVLTRECPKVRWASSAAQRQP